MALRYQAGRDGVPVVVAKGHGELAERIIALAEEHDVHVQEDAMLATALVQVEIDQRIPPELFKAVAVVVGYVMRQKQRRSA